MRPIDAQLGFAVRVAAYVVIAVWAMHLINWALGYELNRFGVWPRHLVGLVGVFVAPLLHISFQHLIANTVPLFVALAGILIVHQRSAPVVIVGVWVGSGLLLWVFGRGLIHIGASGVVYGLLSFAFFAGIFRREIKDILLAVAVLALYGSLVWGVFPRFGPVSWDGHLAGAVVGAGIAWAYRRRTS